MSPAIPRRRASGTPPPATPAASRTGGSTCRRTPGSRSRCRSCTRPTRRTSGSARSSTTVTATANGAVIHETGFEDESLGGWATPAPPAGSPAATGDWGRSQSLGYVDGPGIAHRPLAPLGLRPRGRAGRGGTLGDPLQRARAVGGDGLARDGEAAAGYPAAATAFAASCPQRRVDVAPAREPHGRAQAVLLQDRLEGVDRGARGARVRARRVVRDQVDLVDPRVQQLRELQRLPVASR